MMRMRGFGYGDDDMGWGNSYRRYNIYNKLNIILHAFIWKYTNKKNFN